VMVITLES